MLNVITMYKEPSAGNEAQGERAFWRWHDQGRKYIERWTTSVRRNVPTGYELFFIDGCDGPGWWSKLRAFSPEVSSGKCLYTDLDNVLSGPLDALCSLTPDPLIMADDRYFPAMPNGSIMLFNADAPVLRSIWYEYSADPRSVEAEFSEDRWPRASDQAFIADRVRKAGFAIPLFQDLLPPGYLLMARELEAGADWSQTHIVCGQGMPKAHDSKHPFYRAHWHEVAA